MSDSFMIIRLFALTSDVPELDLKYRTSKGDIKLVGGQVITIERLHKKEDNTEHYQWLLSSKDFKRKHQIDVEHQTFWGKVIVAIGT